MKTDNVTELENIEVEKYLDMISKKGYGHTIEDVEKRVRAGIVIAHHIQRQKFAAYDSLLSALKDLLFYTESDFKYKNYTPEQNKISWLQNRLKAFENSKAAIKQAE